MEIKSEETPWATQQIKSEKTPGTTKPWTIVVTKPDKQKQRRVRFKLDPKTAPWRQGPVAKARPTPVPRDEARFYQPSIAPPLVQQEEEEVPPPETGKKQQARPREPPTRLVCSQNYEAVEALRGDYGLIDNGPESGGTKPLLVHVPRREPTPWRVLNAIRPGTSLHLRSRAGGGQPKSVRVRYTTPARYYPPGARVSTLAIGVDLTDWRSLAAEAPHI